MSANPWVMTVLVLVAVAVLIEGLRRFQLYRLQPQRNMEEFDGPVYRVGSAHVSVRASADAPHCSVICMHGFMEDHRYFTDFYRDPDIDLILMTSADYHPPVAGLKAANATWGVEPPWRPGTIEYDAHVLNQVLEHLPRTDRVRLHGHSRGGAVVIEAANQRPELHDGSGRQVEVVLEAPVLPQGEPHPYLAATLNPVGRWLLPFVMPLYKRLPFDLYAKRLYGEVSGRKRELLSQIYFNPRRYATIVVNAISISEWMAAHDHHSFKVCASGVIVVGEDERILDREAMLASARQAGKRFKVLEPAGTTHFVIQDKPEAVPGPFA